MRGGVDKAMLLRRVDVGESDRVVILYTRQSGKVAAIARGARKSKKRFSGVLEPFQVLLCDLQVRRHSDMAMLASAEVVKSHPVFLSNLDAAHAGWRLLELVDAFEQDHHSNPELFDKITHDMERLNRGELTPARWRPRFEALLLSEAGLAPRLDCCVRCERDVEGEAAWFSESEGGLLCRHCRAGAPARELNPPELEALRELFGGGEAEGEALTQRLEELLRFHLGKVPKTSRYFDEIKPS